MLVDFGHDPPLVDLREPDAFDAFKVVAVAIAGDDRLAGALRGVARLEPGGDALVDIDAVHRLAGERGGDARWREGFDDMVAYARTHGWIEDTAIRAHVERRRA